MYHSCAFSTKRPYSVVRIHHASLLCMCSVLPLVFCSLFLSFVICFYFIIFAIYRSFALRIMRGDFAAQIHHASLLSMCAVFSLVFLFHFFLSLFYFLHIFCYVSQLLRFTLYVLILLHEHNKLDYMHVSFFLFVFVLVLLFFCFLFCFLLYNLLCIAAFC